MQYFVSLHNRLYSSGSVFFMMLKNSSLLTARKKRKKVASGTDLVANWGQEVGAWREGKIFGSPTYSWRK
jgi:hypothetical protein